MWSLIYIVDAVLYAVKIFASFYSTNVEKDIWCAVYKCLFQIIRGIGRHLTDITKIKGVTFFF